LRRDRHHACSRRASIRRDAEANDSITGAGSARRHCQPHALLTAVHAHAAVVVTFTVPVLAVEGTFCAVGAIAYVHAGGGAAPAACDTVKVRFAIEMMPVRAAPVFAATANVTTPLPRPVGPDVTVIHGESLATAQSQVLCDCTEMDPEPPAAGTFWPVGEMVVLQFGGAAAD
jgi:hypothetical protein